MSAPLRIAVVGTPRSGNSWLRALLHHGYRVPVFAVHDMTEEFCESLPPEAVVQIHWPRTPEFADRLRRHGFSVLTLARHPLDVLISILHFAWYEPDTGSWLLGRGGNELGIRAAMPRSRPFLDYCTGPRASALLAVTPDWWGQPDAVSLRYEDMVADPLGGLYDLTDRFGPLRGPDPQELLETCSLRQSRTASVNNHFWKGQPGHWRELLPAAEADEILAAVRPVCDALGYDAVPDEALTATQADANWVACTGQELADTVRKNVVGFRAEVDRLHAVVAAAHVEKETAVAERDAAQHELNELIEALTAARRPPESPPAMRKHLGATAARIEDLFRLQRFPLKVAEFVQGVKNAVRWKKQAV